MVSSTLSLIAVPPESTSRMPSLPTCTAMLPPAPATMLTLPWTCSNSSGGFCASPAAVAQSRTAALHRNTWVGDRGFIFEGQIVAPNGAARGFPLFSPSRSEQTVNFDDEGAVRKGRETAGQCVPILVEHDKELAAGTILPPQPHIRADIVAARVVLQQRAREHLRGHRVGDARPHEVVGKRAFRQVDDIELICRLG